MTRSDLGGFVAPQVDHSSDLCEALSWVFRTLDVGADKPLPFVAREPEPNPALGVRGIRLSLRRPKLFEDQLRALLRAHRDRPGGGPTGVMFPLVSRVDEVIAARSELERVAGEEGVSLDGVEVGVMIEVPSAALAAGRIAPHVDFFSVGTNACSSTCSPSTARWPS